jgi:23S rRNA (cytidine1920-2'-O)/16S rRNA (cytidine1409-2'-O)-methyltransferase
VFDRLARGRRSVRAGNGIIEQVGGGTVTVIATRQRLDAELVRRELAGSRERARELIAEKRVQVNGSFADNAARLVERGDSIELVADGPRFVSRGGLKIEKALDEFGVEVTGRRVLDVGASTGGFTDCLLQRGAAAVLAVDVGYGQLHESLRADPRVTNMERTNIRSLSPEEAAPLFSLIVGDLSFISMGAVLDQLVRFAADGADMVLLIKPQFEARREEADKGRGVIRDPVIWQRVLEDVAASAAAVGAHLQSATPSPVRGADGNVEFLFHLVVGSEPGAVDLVGLVAQVESRP